MKPPINSNAYMDALEAAEAEKMELEKDGHDNDWGVGEQDLNELFED